MILFFANRSQSHQCLSQIFLLCHQQQRMFLFLLLCLKCVSKTCSQMREENKELFEKHDKELLPWFSTLEQWSSFHPPQKNPIGLFPIKKNWNFLVFWKSWEISTTGTRVSFSKVVKIAQISPKTTPQVFPTFIKTTKKVHWDCY